MLTYIIRQVHALNKDSNPESCYATIYCDKMLLFKGFYKTDKIYGI